MTSRVRLIACALLLWSLAGVGMAQDIYESSPGTYATEVLKLSRQLDGRNELLIRSATHLSGKITIATADGDAALVSYTKRAKTDSRSRAFDFIDLMSVSLDLLPGKARLDLRAPNPAPWDKARESGIIDVVITVPRECSVVIEATYYDVEAVGPFGSMTIGSSLGRMDISHVRSGLVLVTANQRVTLVDISGTVSVSTTNAELSCNDLRTGKESAVFRNDGGDIKITDIEGSVNVSADFGRIDIDGFRVSGESSFIRGTSAPVTIGLVEMKEGQLVVSNRYEDIEISVPSDISAYFSLAVEDGNSIEATNFKFQTDLVKSNRLTFHAGEGDVSISGSVRGKGNIYLRGVDRRDDH